MFFVAKDDGTLSLPVKGMDGHYHVPGELKVANRDQVLHILKTAKPLFENNVQKVLVLPIPRYCYPDLKCCEKAGHLTNADPALDGVIRAGLTAVKKTVKSFLFKEKIKNVKVMDPYVTIANINRDLFADPVHLLQAGYEDLATGVLQVLDGEDGGGTGADQQSSSGEGGKRIRILSLGTSRGGGSGTPGTRGRPRDVGPPLQRPRGGRGGRGSWRGGWFGKPKGSL
jgi:hypothetical protein